MPLPVDSPARREARAGIKKIAKAIKDLGVDELDLQQLKSLNIRVDFLSLDGVSPHRATFFAPCPADQLPDFNDDTVSHPYNGIDDDPKPDSVFYCPGFHRPLDRSIGINIHLDSYIQSCRYSRYFTGREFPWTSKPVAFYPFTGLYRHSKPEHGCFCLTDLEDPAYPHVKATVFNNIALQAESTLLYGELLPALRIMLTQLRRSQFANQTVSPVLFISLLGLKARIMEFYFSNGTLVVRHTKMFDFTHGNDEAFKTLAQWYLGDAIGDTVNGV